MNRKFDDDDLPDGFSKLASSRQRYRDRPLSELARNRSRWPSLGNAIERGELQSETSNHSSRANKADTPDKR